MYVSHPNRVELASFRLLKNVLKINY